MTGSQTYIRTLEYVREKGGDVYLQLPLNYDPSRYHTHEDAAKALYSALVELANALGQNGEREVFLWSPQDMPHGHEQWVVSWEAGPFEWATEFSSRCEGPWGYVEPHYSFDLCFTH